MFLLSEYHKAAHSIRRHSRQEVRKRKSVTAHVLVTIVTIKHNGMFQVPLNSYRRLCK